MIIFTQDSYKNVLLKYGFPAGKKKEADIHNRHKTKRLDRPLLDLIIQVVHTFFRMIILAQDSSTKMT